MFSDEGYAGVRIDDLVRRAKVNKATFYYYYESKQEIFRDVFTFKLTNFKDKLSCCLEGAESAEERIGALVDLMFEKELKDVKLFSREIIDGGENFSPEIYAMMSDLAATMSEIFGGDRQENSFIMVHLLAGVSDFYISMSKFRDGWMRQAEAQQLLYPASFEESAIRNKVKEILIAELTNRDRLEV